MTTCSFAEALRQTQAYWLRERADVVLLGESVGRLGGVFRTSEGLLGEFGPDRVVDTPLSEAGVVGLATGLALAGQRPIVELVGAAHDTLQQVAVELASVASRSNGEWTAPVVIRAPVGQLPGAQGIADLAGVWADVPGLRVAAASSPQDAAGLLVSALHHDGPTVLLEDMSLYATRGPVDFEPTPLSARVLCSGEQATLLAWGGGVRLAEQAAAALPELSLGVVDLRSLSPLDVPTVAAELRKSGRALFVGPQGALSDKVLQRLTREAFLYLESPPTTAPAELAGLTRAVVDAIQF